MAYSSDQNWNSQSFLFDLHVSLVAAGRTSVSSIIQTFCQQNKCNWTTATVLQYSVHSVMHQTILQYSPCILQYTGSIFYLKSILSCSFLCFALLFFSRGLRDSFTRLAEGALFTPEQEEAICTMVVENSGIRLREVQSAIMEDNDIFNNIQTASQPLTGCWKDTKWIWSSRAPSILKKNGERAKELRYQYVPPHTCMEEAGFNLTKRTRCAPHSLIPVRTFFSAWKVYDRQSHTQMTHLVAMEAVSQQMPAEAG